MNAIISFTLRYTLVSVRIEFSGKTTRIINYITKETKKSIS